MVSKGAIQSTVCAIGSDSGCFRKPVESILFCPWSTATVAGLGCKDAYIDTEAVAFLRLLFGRQGIAANGSQLKKVDSDLDFFKRI
jgi:hypothetical protein